MRIRNRGVRLPLSALLPTPLSHLQIRSSIAFPVRVTDSRAQDLNLCGANGDEGREGTYSRRDEMGNRSGRRNFSLGGTMEEFYEQVLQGEATLGGGESAKGEERVVEIAKTANYAPWIPSKEGGCCINGVRTGEETSIQILAMPSRSLPGDETMAPPSKELREKREIRRADNDARESVGLGSHVDGASDGKRLREDGFERASDGGGKEGRVRGAFITPEKKTATNRSTSGGSRCSRMNGRGWRCCQQTLVGYSLCEYHLGKGKLRSIARVASRGEQDLRPNLTAPASTLKIDNGGATDPAGSEAMPPILTKKRGRIGVVKARSLKTLLGLSDKAQPGDFHG